MQRNLQTATEHLVSYHLEPAVDTCIQELCQPIWHGAGAEVAKIGFNTLTFPGV